MNKAIVTKAGSRRIGIPQGTIIEYDSIGQFSCVENFFVNGVRAGGTAHIVHKADDKPSDPDLSATLYFYEKEL